MTESEAIEEIVNSGIELGAGDYVDVEALKVAVKALEEVQQYRAIIGLTPEELKLLEKDEIQTIGEVLKTFSEWYKYKAIGTVSELRENENFLEFLYNHIQPNEMEQYLSMYHASERKGVGDAKEK